MFIAVLTLISALSISSVAAFYSIVGLATIFPGAYWPVVLMGSVLEAGKLVCASWLYRNWHITHRALRTYLFTAVIILSLITSMGIFGFLSKAHLETNFQSNNNSQQISIINSQIKAEQDVIDRQQEIIKRNSGAGGGSGERIAQLRDRIKQMDAEVKAYTDQGATSTLFNDKVAKGIALKESQKPERDKIDAEIRQLTLANQGNNSAAESQIARSQQKIQQLINQRAPLQSAQIKIDAEIGPIKYIGALAVDVGLAKEVNVEAAVRWVIIIIIFVFDPLAVLMLVAANQSFARQFPTLMEKPRDIIDLERPDLDLPPAPEPKSNIIDNIKKRYESQLKDWQEKLAKFNERAPAPEAKPIEIVSKEEVMKDNDAVSYSLKDAVEIKADEEDSEKKRPEQEITQDNDSEKKRPEQEITQDNESKKKTERLIPDLTEVIEPTQPDQVATLGTVLVKKKKPVILEKKIDPAKSDTLLKTFHDQYGLFEDVSEDELKTENEITDTNTIENTAVEQTGLTTITVDELKEQFGIETPTKEFDILLQDGKKIRVPKKTYVQNEEQLESNQWSKILEIKEPEKNESITKYKNKVLSNDEYRRRIEDRINGLITKIEQGEIKLGDLSKEDQQVINDLMNSNE
jgi:hypothetical protein